MVTAGLFLLAAERGDKKDRPWCLMLSATQAETVCLDNLLTVTELDRSFIRYLWIPESPTVPSDIKAVSFTLHWISNNSIPHRPPVFGGRKVEGRDWYESAIVRVDLRQYAVNDQDLDRWIKTWDKLTFDPNFSLLIEFDSIKLISDRGGKIPPQIESVSDNHMRVAGRDVTVLRLPALTLDLVVHGRLESLCQSVAPVVHYQYFINRALSSIRGKGLFKDVFGGLYYDFANIRTAKQAGKKEATDLDVLFEDLGVIDDADGKVKVQDKLDRLSSEQRVIMLHSQVTGKPRVVHIIPTLKSIRRRGVVLLTLDVKDENINLLKSSFANLIDFKADALEVIFVDANGSQKYALYNADFALQEEVPPDIANDTTVPDPYTKRLHAISCIVCHGTANNDGWKPMPNEVLLRRTGLEPLIDLTDKKKTQAEVLNLLASKYGGNADQLLLDMRRDVIGSTLQATGPWEGEKDQTGVHRLTAAKIQELRNGYWYTEVDAAIALRELWVDRGDRQALDVLTELLPPDILSKNDVLGVIPEDWRLAQLLSGRAIPRPQWELVKGFAITRVQQALEREREKRE